MIQSPGGSHDQGGFHGRAFVNCGIGYRGQAVQTTNPVDRREDLRPD
jgi:hypothetical protein